MKNKNQPNRKGLLRRNAMVALCALIMVVVVCPSMIGGTLAYLKQVTPKIENTFELGDLTYVLNFDENVPENTESVVSGMPQNTYEHTGAVTEHTFEVTEIPALTGYKFVGWANVETSETADYPLAETKDKCDVKVEYGEATAEYVDGVITKTVYAVWEPIHYTIEYDANATTGTAATGETAASVHTYDEPKALTENGFVRTGYTFIGWNTQPDGSGVSYANAEKVTNLTTEDNATVKLYAQWGVKSYVIRYHANGGEGEMPDQVIEYDKLTKLSENAFTKTDGDYKFAGWSTTPTGEVEYLENQQVVNLLESGTLDLYAVWKLNSYTVTFDYNIGYGTPPTKEVLYGEEYGVLPPYLTTETENLFEGWYTAPEGGNRVYPSTIVNLKEDHTLWAHWDPSPANDVIKNLVVHSSADDDKDGVADEMHLEFVCSSSFEKFNVPLHNLVPGQTYTLTYTTSNNASFGDYVDGYKNSRYGSYILKEATNTAGNVSTDEPHDILATWNDRIEADGNNDGSHAATNDDWLNGPWKDRTITFTATAETMYWAWEFGLIEDGKKYDYNIYDISLEPVKPKIEFGNKTLLKPPTYNAKIVSWHSGNYDVNFTFDGDGGCETIYYPITGLVSGTTYTITFDHKFTGGWVNSTSYDYGCGIMTKKPTEAAMGAKMSSLGNWASDTFIETTLNATRSVTLTFKADGDTAYWVWNMANASDGIECTVDVDITKFSAKHNGGGTITYYTATSSASAKESMMAFAIAPITVELSDVAVTGADSIIVGQPCVLNLSGEGMPDILQVDVNGAKYMMSLVGGDIEGFAANMGASVQNDWAAANDDGSYALTIPAELVTEETVITLSGYDAVSLDMITIGTFTPAA